MVLPLSTRIGSLLGLESCGSGVRAGAASAGRIGDRELLLAGVRYLRDHPEALELDPERYPPLVEGFERRGAGARVAYRQEWEMEFGTLVALYRGVLTLEDLSGGEVRHERSDAPPPRDWSPVEPRDARRLWREVRAE